MRVIGADINASGLSWVALDGSAKSCVMEGIKPPKLSLPVVEATQIDSLLALKANVIATLASLNAEFVAVVKAGKDCSVERVKIECMVQLAAKDAGIACVLVPPQTVSAAEKRHLSAEADAATQAVVAGIEPKYLKKAAMAAWCVLNGRR